MNTNEEQTILREEIIKSLSNDPDSIAEIQYLLEKVNSDQSYYISDLFQGEQLSVPKWFFIVPLLSLTVCLSIFLGFFNNSYLLILLGLAPVNAAIHFYNKWNVNKYVYSIPMLLSLNAVAKKIRQLKHFKKLSPSISESIKVIDQIKRRVAIFKLEIKIESDLEVIYWFLLELIKITFLLEPLLLFSIVGKLKSRKTEIREVFEYVGTVDSILSTIALRQHVPHYCSPTITDNSTEIKAIRVFHPLIENCVENSINTENNSVLLTGSNMSGKTTFIRAIGINVISGLVLNTCFAESFSFPKGNIHTSIRISDDISSASSYFFKEVETVKNIIDKAEEGSFNLILIDEIFKGTNTIERIAAAKAILSYLQDLNCLVFVSTHDIELTEMLGPKYTLYHFKENIENDTLTFDYKLKEGVPKEGNAIEILDIENYPKSLVQEARSLANQMIKNKS